MKRLKHWNFSPLFHKLKDNNTKKGDHRMMAALGFEV